MLRLNRHRLYRLSSSYASASCLATWHASSIRCRQRIVAGHHARHLSTTIACREAAAPTASDAPADKPPAAITVEAKPQQPKKKKKKQQPDRGISSTSPATPEQGPQTDAQRQLKVLQGALSALKNVLTTRGVDVGQIPTTNPATPAESTTEAKSKRTPRPKSRSKKRKAELSESSSSVPATAEAAQPDQSPELSTPDANAAANWEIRASAKAETEAKTEAEAEAKPKPKPKPKRNVKAARPTKSRPLRKPAPVRRAESKSPTKQSEEPDESEKKPATARPAYLGVPFGAIPTKHLPQSKQGKRPDEVDATQSALVPIETNRPHVPPLSYGLDRVIFNPGVYQLQDPRSRVYNFDPYLSQIMPVQEFDFNALKQYVTSSKDSTLISIAKQHQKKYTGSTSSMTSMLAHFHFLLSAWRDINVSMLSKSFLPDSLQFTRIMKAPAAIFLHWKDGTYAIDADKEFDTANVLSMLGKSMEKLLTLSKDGYERYRHGNSDQITEEERNAEEAFHYTGFQDFMMRSQLDSHDERVPGTGMFDLKTRAVITIRMDAKGYEKGLGYEIRGRLGQWESFEREYYDMIRSAFLKYSLQVRMGRMDGIFVAFHNIQRIFGFQYIPLTEMDTALHGSDNQLVGTQEFELSLKLLNELLNRATQKWPEQSLRLHFETRTSTGAPFMYVFAEPTSPEEIAAVQNASRLSIEAFERDILGLVKHAAEDAAEQPTEADEANGEDPDGFVAPPSQETDSFAAWQEARQMVEEAMGDDERGVGLVREAIADALEQSGILRARSQAESREYVNALLGALTGRTPSAQTDAVTVPPNEEATVDEDELEEQATNESQDEPDQSLRLTPLPSGADVSTLHPAPDQGIEAEGGLGGALPGHTNTEDPAPTRDEYEGDIDSLQQKVPSIPPEGSSDPDEPAVDTREVSSTTANADTDNATIATPTSSEPKGPEEEFEEDDDYEETSEAELEADEPSEDAGSSSLEPLKSLIMRMAQRLDERPISDTDIGSPQDDASKLKEFERILGRLISQSRTEQLERVSGKDVPDQDPSSEPTPLVTSPADYSMYNEIASTPDGQGEEAPQPAAADQPQLGEDTKQPELLGMTLTIKNKVNGSYVERPNKLGKGDNWTVEYEIEEVQEPRAQKIYTQLKDRRRKVFIDTGDKDREWYKMWKGSLDDFTKKGRAYRQRETLKAEGQPMYMVGAERPLHWVDVFRTPPKSLQTMDEGSPDQKAGQKEDQKEGEKEGE